MAVNVSQGPRARRFRECKTMSPIVTVSTSYLATFSGRRKLTITQSSLLDSSLTLNAKRRLSGAARRAHEDLEAKDPAHQARPAAVGGPYRRPGVGDTAKAEWMGNPDAMRVGRLVRAALDLTLESSRGLSPLLTRSPAPSQPSRAPARLGPASALRGRTSRGSPCGGPRGRPGARR